jgi:hypothetical protein
MLKHYAKYYSLPINLPLLWDIHAISKDFLIQTLQEVRKGSIRKAAPACNGGHLAHLMSNGLEGQADSMAGMLFWQWPLQNKHCNIIAITNISLQVG